MTTKSFITIIDICSSKVVCIIADHDFSVLGIGYTKAEGIKAGIISDIKLAQSSIAEAVSSAEKVAGVKVTKACITISSANLISQHIIAETIVAGREISDKDLNKLLLDSINLCKQQQLEVIHSFACDYILDGNRGISNPLGMYGTKLGCKFHILSAPANSLLNLYNCVTQAGVDVDGYISASYAAGLGSLTKDEMETGVMLIDFGAGVTELSVFENEYLVYTDAIQIGGNHITNDIAKVLCIPVNEAERIKNIHGGVMSMEVDGNENISLDTNDDGNVVTRTRLVDIIQARLDEIIQIIEDKITDSRAKINNIVITGGVARTLKLKELVSEKLSAKVRVGYPHDGELLNDNQKNSLELVTAVGALRHIKNNVATSTSSDDQQDKGGITNLMSWIKKTFF